MMTLGKLVQVFTHILILHADYVTQILHVAYVIQAIL